MRIALVSAPFASRAYPSLALGLLKPILVGEGHCVDVHYLNLLYAELIGVSHYELLSDGHSVHTGELLFSAVIQPELLANENLRQEIESFLPWSEYEELVKVAHDFVECAAGLLTAANPDVVGFSSSFFQRQASLAIAERVKSSNQRIKIIFGGADCESPMGEALISQNEFIDAVFHGDSEQSLLQYLRALKSGISSMVPGVSFRLNSGQICYGGIGVQTDLDENPTPDFDDFIVASRMFGSVPDDWQLLYESSRGCWWGEKSHCTFCGLNGRQMSYRRKSTDLVVKQLSELRERYGARTTLFADNIVPSDASRDLLPSIERVPDLKYFFETKANLKRTDFEAMSRSRVIAIQPGIERINSQVLKLMKKGTTAYQNIQVLRLGDEFGIQVYWNYLFGFSGESEEGIREELSLLRKLFHLPPPYSVSRIRLDRYSPIFNSPQHHGVKLDQPIGRDRWPIKGLSSNEVVYFFGSKFLSKIDESNETLWTELIALINEWKAKYKPGQLTYKVCKSEVIILDTRNCECHEICLSGSVADAFLALEARPMAENRAALLCELTALNDLSLIQIVEGIPIVLPTRRYSKH